MNAVDNEAKLVREWLLGVMKRTGKRPTPLAREAGLSPSTILRALDETNPSSLERRTIRKIVDKHGGPAPTFADAQFSPGGFSEPELTTVYLDTPVFAGATLSPDQYVKEVNSRALELAGWPAGTQALFDMSVEPQPGDVVEAQIYNHVRGTAETIPRLFDPPYIVARTADPDVNQKPQLVDGVNVKIMAVAIKSLWVRE
ncbi:MAG TPA: hypothetical protein PK857_00440 [Hyphomicrobium sp.]|nr:hypothetical protein [Hyphomicrobium sp.]HRO48792.1 hypothetical protein [Hyphomicrobium sp.]